MGTASPDIERTDQGILEFARAAFEGESRLEDLLFVLNFEGVCGEKMFNVSGDLGRAPLQEAAENPNDFENCSEVHKSGVWFAQLPIDDLIGLARLFWVVLKQIAQEDVGIETGHLRKLSVAPTSIAACISSKDMGRLSFGTLPLSFDVRIFGRITTAPSG